ncbi:MAG: hypothetical protein NZ749_10870 [bacterium]|nr:hypothetical protein [bacterium]
MSKRPADPKKTLIWAIIAVLAIALAAFSAYKSLIQPQQGKNVGFVDMFPGGKAGLMKGGESPETQGGAPADVR